MKEHKYKTKYKLEPEHGEFTAKELRESGLGGTDALFIFSLIYPEDGSFSMQFTSFDGRNEGEELGDGELFKLWSMLASRLGRSKTLQKGKKDFAQDVFDSFTGLLGIKKTPT